jgi:hypothetical protein
MSRIIVLAVVFSLGVAGRCQTEAGGAPLQVRLAKLAAASLDLQKHLPNFACKESLISQELHGSKVKREVRASGELRVVQDGMGKPIEHFQATERNGQTITPDRLRAPIYVSGGFANVLDYFEADMQACFRYSVSGNRVDFESSPDVHTTLCDHHSETRGFAMFNDDDDITHLERTVPYELARQRNAVPFVSIDLSRVELGGSSFLLSTHVVAEIPMAKDNLRWEANYSECRLFSVSVTIGPATPADPDHDGSGAGHGPPNP